MSRLPKSTSLTGAVAALVLTAACGSGVCAAAAESYTITSLGLPPVINDRWGHPLLSYGNPFPTGINDLGQVCGSVDVDSSYFNTLGISNVRHPWLWENGVIIDLEPLDAYGYPADFGYAAGINNAGTVVGTSSIGNREAAVVWQNGVKTVLDPNEAQSSGGRAINELGHVAGYSAGRAVIWRDGLKSDMGLTEFLLPTGINDADQVCGALSNANGFYGSAIWQNGIVTPITPLGFDAGVSWAGAYGINAAGHVVGESSHSDNTYHAFLWRNGTTIDLGVLGVSTTTYTQGAASAINDFGQVVGGSTAGDGNNHGFLWQDANGNGASDPGEMVDLNTLLPPNSGVEIIGASGINNRGQIVGYAIFPGTGDGGFLLTPPPTPAERIQILSASITSLVQSGVSLPADGRSLLAKLNAAGQNASAGNLTATSNELHAFINQIKAFVGSRKLTAAQGQALIDAAQAIITTLDG